MTRSESDSWDLASSVGTTATMVAAARALASRDDDALFDDPFAAPLVRAVGLDFFTKLVDGGVPPSDDGEVAGSKFMIDTVAVRTRFYDDFFADAGAAGIRQAVILASGLDSRAYRLQWADGSVVYEIDQPQVIEFKSATMTSVGASAATELRTIGIDLREDWPTALRESGFDDTLPTAWIAEGLLVYLPPEAQDRLLDNIGTLSAPGSRLATEYHPDAGAAIGQRVKAVSHSWDDHGFDVNIADLFYQGERRPVADYLGGRGWQVSSRSRREVFAAYGREFPDVEQVKLIGNSLCITAIRI